MEADEEIKQLWQEAGGLIPANIAMVLLGLKSKGTITKWVKRGKLEGYEIPKTKTRLLSYSQVIKLAKERKDNATS